MGTLTQALCFKEQRTWGFFLLSHPSLCCPWGGCILSREILKFIIQVMTFTSESEMECQSHPAKRRAWHPRYETPQEVETLNLPVPKSEAQLKVNRNNCYGVQKLRLKKRVKIAKIIAVLICLCPKCWVIRTPGFVAPPLSLGPSYAACTFRTSEIALIANCLSSPRVLE